MQKAFVPSHLKNMNRQLVYSYILEQEITSRAEIEKSTGISAPTVIKIVDFLKEQGLICEIGESTQTTVGRKPHLISVNHNAFYVLSFLLEGEFLSMGVIDNTHDVIFHKTVHMNVPFTEVWNRIENELIDRLIGESGIDRVRLAGIGIGIPAALDIKKKVIWPAPMIGVDEPLQLKDRLLSVSKKYGVPLFVENDANAYCIGEMWLRREESIQDLVFISMGTGIGAGIILREKILRGRDGKAGEIGTGLYGPSLGKAPRQLEQLIGYKALQEKFGFYDLSGLTNEKKEQISKHLSSYLTVVIHNVSVLLGCENIVLGGITSRALGPSLLRAVCESIAKLKDRDIRVREQGNEDTGLIGIAKELIENHISEILTEE